MRITDASGKADKEFSMCFQCGECASSCPVFMTASDKYNPRSIVGNLVVAGVRPHDLAWLCLNCYECLERCPSGTSVAELMTKMKSEASETGNIPEGTREVLNNLVETGKEVRITQSALLKRQKLGLEPVAAFDPGETLKLLEVTGLRKLLSKRLKHGNE